MVKRIEDAARNWKASVNFYRGVFYTTKQTAEQMQQTIDQPTTIAKAPRGYYLTDATGRPLGPDGFLAA